MNKCRTARADNGGDGGHYRSVLSRLQSHLMLHEPAAGRGLQRAGAEICKGAGAAQAAASAGSKYMFYHYLLLECS